MKNFLHFTARQRRRLRLTFLSRHDKYKSNSKVSHSFTVLTSQVKFHSPSFHQQQRRTNGIHHQHTNEREIHEEWKAKERQRNSMRFEWVTKWISSWETFFVDSCSSGSLIKAAISLNVLTSHKIFYSWSMNFLFLYFLTHFTRRVDVVVNFFLLFTSCRVIF